MTTATSSTKTIYVGDRNFNPDRWEPYAWQDVLHGPQVAGEVAVIRPEGTSGTLQAGLWRTGRGIAGCQPDGSCLVSSAPNADSTQVILEGTAEITETATGKKHHIEAGSILSHPKGVDLSWEIHGPFFKKFWVKWDSRLAATPEDHVYVAHITDDSMLWRPFEWAEPEHGLQVCGETLTVRDTGSTGTLILGLWRTGVGLPGCAPNGSATIRYSAPTRDETILLLEGQARLANDETGEEYEFKAGDIICLPAGLPVTWTSKAPFLKKFFVLTNEALPGS